MAKFAMQIDTAHAVLFLADAAPNIAVPPDTGAAFVTATDTCIAFWVLHYVDGTSIVTITDEMCPDAGLPLFSGTIHASSGVLTLSDSSNFNYLQIPVPSGVVDVSISADHDRHPAWVWVRLGAIRSI